MLCYPTSAARNVSRDGNDDAFAIGTETTEDEILAQPIVRDPKAAARLAQVTLLAFNGSATYAGQLGAPDVLWVSKVVVGEWGGERAFGGCAHGKTEVSRVAQVKSSPKIAVLPKRLGEQLRIPLVPGEQLSIRAGESQSLHPVNKPVAVGQESLREPGPYPFGVG